MRGHDLRNFCRDLLAHLRDLLVTKVSEAKNCLESAVCDRERAQTSGRTFFRIRSGSVLSLAGRNGNNSQNSRTPSLPVGNWTGEADGDAHSAATQPITRQTCRVEESIRTGKSLTDVKTVPTATSRSHEPGDRQAPEKATSNRYQWISHSYGGKARAGNRTHRRISTCPTTFSRTAACGATIHCQ